MKFHHIISKYSVAKIDKFEEQVLEAIKKIRRSVKRSDAKSIFKLLITGLDIIQSNVQSTSLQ